MADTKKTSTGAAEIKPASPFKSIFPLLAIVVCAVFAHWIFYSNSGFSAPENFPLVAGSDHVNYWLNDYPAVQVSDMLPLRVPKNYAPSAIKLNYERIAQVAQALTKVVADLDDDAKESSEKSDYFSVLAGRITDFFE